jgi:hypothetical protein
LKRAFQINKKIVGVFKGRLLFFSCERLTVERLLIQKADAKCKIVRNEKSKSNYLLTYSTYRKEFSCPIFEVFQTNTSLFLLMFLFLLLILFLFFTFYFWFCFCFYFLLLILLLTIPCHKALTNLSSQPSHFHVRCWFLFLYFIFDCLRTQCLYLVQVWFAFFNGFYAITTLLVIKITTTSFIKLLDISNLILNMKNESIKFS